MSSFEIEGQIIDIENEDIFAGRVSVVDNKIASLDRDSGVSSTNYIMPGFIDAHVHIESSMLVPSEFARLAVVHGTVATVSDPHEIGNVLGVSGVKYMLDNGEQVNFKFFFGAPSCVPATPFETAGASIGVDDIKELFEDSRIKYLAEMMNWPGVLQGDEAVAAKIAVAKSHNLPIDGHAPGLRGEDARQYAAAGISTDHECFTREEAEDKLACGMKIVIREGSAAKNFEALADLLHDHSDNIMFCSDDKHPDNLVEGHINLLAKRALTRGIDIFKVLRASCKNPVDHYNLPVGQLRAGDPADFIVVDNLDNLNVLQTYINGEMVAREGVTNIKSQPLQVINNFNIGRKHAEDFAMEIEGNSIKVMEALDGQLITNSLEYDSELIRNENQTNVAEDILKLSVVNRYEEERPALGYIKNFGIKTGAIASTVGHDSHNIIAVGVDNQSICEAVNLLVDCQGGVSAYTHSGQMVLPLPIAGLMSDQDGYLVAEKYSEIDQMAKAMGSTLASPFMTLSFMALLVIPALKLSDKGLFDGENFQFTSANY